MEKPRVHGDTALDADDFGERRNETHPGPGLANATESRALRAYLPFHTGFRFSANARGPSTTSSLVKSFCTSG